MDVDFSQAVALLRGMATGFFALLPYLVVSLVVYALFHVAGRYANTFIGFLSKRRRRHRSLGRLLGRPRLGVPNPAEL